MLATLYDLAGRGALRIEESGTGLLGSKKYNLVLLPSGAALQPHEEALLGALFRERDGLARDTLPLSQAASRLAARSKEYRQALEGDLEAAGWLDPARKTARNGLMGLVFIGVVLGTLGGIGGIVLAGMAINRGASPALGAAVAGVGGTLFLLGIAAALAVALFSPLSERGERAAASWKGFAAYLKEAMRGREPFYGEEQFERYLPFVAGLGLAVRWARYAQKQGYSAVPTWFRGLDVEGAHFGAFVAAISSTNSSFSSGSGGASGASGASGGGASGAG